MIRFAIANCSGFYGDRLSAMREMLDGGSIDVVTGDYLAELTMLILGRDRMRDPSLGYAKTFVRQVEDCLGTALERGVKIVSNAGGLNPAGLVEKLREVASGLGLDPAIAWVDGDDLMPERADELGFGGRAHRERLPRCVRHLPRPRGGRRHRGDRPGHRRLGRGGSGDLAARLVGRGSTTSWPAPWWPGTSSSAARQATGGNFSGFLDLPRDGRPLGFPLAEIAADGSSVITKHDGTGGLVSVDTVTAQLMYEVQSHHYLGPDVTVDLSTIQLAQDGPDRVGVSGVRGVAPPEQLKVCVNELGGWRNQVEFVLTGLDVEEKAAWVRAQLEGRIPAASVTWSMDRLPVGDAVTEEAASCLLRCVVKDPDADKVGRDFTGAAIELALASYPGFSVTAPPGPGSPYGVYRPAYVDRDTVTHTVHLPDGTTEVIPDGAGGPFETGLRPSSGTRIPGRQAGCRRHHPAGPARHLRARPVGRQGWRRQPRAVGAVGGTAGGAGRVAAGIPDRRRGT